MTEKLELYKCQICTNLVEVAHSGEGTLVCCNQDMIKTKENIAPSENPHYAHIKEENGTKIITFNHVMTPEHHLEFIEIISNDKKYIKRKYLKEDEFPQMEIKCDCKEGFYIRLYCNVDGVWVTKV